MMLENENGIIGREEKEERCFEKRNSTSWINKKRKYKENVDLKKQMTKGKTARGKTVIKKE